MLGQEKGRQLSDCPMNYVLFDLETTGISVYQDAVIELSALKVENGKVTAEYSSLVNPGRPIPWNASMVNGITDEMVADEPCFETVLKEFLDFAGDAVLVGHNIGRFDLSFLYRDAERYWGKLPGNDYVDSLPLARRLLPGLAHYTLSDLASHYGISTKGAHRALADCHMNQQVVEALRRETPAEELLCPRCGSILKKRNGRFGAFWGCSGYPDCRYTKNC